MMCCDITINMLFPMAYRAPNRIIGRAGENMKRIKDATGASAKVRGMDPNGDDKNILGPIKVS